MLRAKRVVADATVQSRNCSGSLSGIATGPVPAASATDASGSRSRRLDRDGQYLASSLQGMFAGDIQIGEARSGQRSTSRFASLKLQDRAAMGEANRKESRRKTATAGTLFRTGELRGAAAGSLFRPRNQTFRNQDGTVFRLGHLWRVVCPSRKTTTRMAPALPLLGPFLFGRCRHLGWHHGLRSG